MLERFLIVLSAGLLLHLFYKWAFSKKDEQDETSFDDYSHPNPPMYVYYNSSGLQMPIALYFTFSALLSILIALIFNRLLENIIGSLIILFVTFSAAKQQIVIRSIRRSQIIDNDAPGFLVYFNNMIQSLNNPIFALGQSIKYAHPSYRKAIEVLHTRLQNGRDPYLEIEMAKKTFRNRVLRNFLDDFGEHLMRGNVLTVTLERLVDRAEDRKAYAEERKVETYAGVLVIYIGIIAEAVMAGAIALLKPDLLQVFVDSPMGQMAVWMIVAVTGFMIIVAQRLILLSEG